MSLEVEKRSLNKVIPPAVRIAQEKQIRYMRERIKKLAELHHNQGIALIEKTKFSQLPTRLIYSTNNTQSIRVARINRLTMISIKKSSTRRQVNFLKTILRLPNG